MPHKQQLRASVLPFEGFMEAVCRVATMKALPTQDEVRGGGFSDAAGYLEALQAMDDVSFNDFLLHRKIEWGDKLQRDPEDFPWRLEAMISILLHATTHVKLDPSLSRPHRHGFV